MTDWLPPRAPGGPPPAPPAGDEGEWLPPGAAGTGGPPQPAPESPVPPAPPRPAGSAGGNGQAVAALVLGIVALTLLVLSLGLLAIVTLPLSVAALVLGRRGRRRADQGAPHRGIAQAGFVLGVTGTVLGLLAIIALTVLIALDDGFVDDVQREIEQRDSATTLDARAW